MDQYRNKDYLEEKSILGKLISYSKSDYYPMHMPGHKRNFTLMGNSSDVFSIDLTEIPDFDDLHNPEGIIKESMEFARENYQSYQSFYSCNGSTSSVLSAIAAAVPFEGRILVPSNRHWSVDNAIELFHLDKEIIQIERLEDNGPELSANPLKIKSILDEAEKAGKKFSAVLIVSPTYEGVVSDIEKISDIVHKHGAYLIVDQAHGAHFSYSSRFPTSAAFKGADIVIESLHKTLPSMTGTAILHLMKKDEELKEKIKHYLDIFISSSPSYVMLASIDNCIRYMSSKDGKKAISIYMENMDEFYKKVSSLKHIEILSKENSKKIFDHDRSRITILASDKVNTISLEKILREKYHIVSEKLTDYELILITTVCDSREGFERLYRALKDIDDDLLYNG